MVITPSLEARHLRTVYAQHTRSAVGAHPAGDRTGENKKADLSIGLPPEVLSPGS
jgi:hypothetical protein